MSTQLTSPLQSMPFVHLPKEVVCNLGREMCLAVAVSRNGADAAAPLVSVWKEQGA